MIFSSITFFSGASLNCMLPINAEGSDFIGAYVNEYIGISNLFVVGSFVLVLFNSESVFFCSKHNKILRYSAYLRLFCILAGLGFPLYFPPSISQQYRKPFTSLSLKNLCIKQALIEWNTLSPITCEEQKLPQMRH